jgi:hypothetical protein
MYFFLTKMKMADSEKNYASQSDPGKSKFSFFGTVMAVNNCKKTQAVDPLLHKLFIFEIVFVSRAQMQRKLWPYS